MSDISKEDYQRKFEYRPFRLHPPYNVIMPAIQDKTLLTERRLRILNEAAIHASVLDGDAAEAGVWRGGSLYLIAATLHHKTIHGFDSWQGLPPATPEDGKTPMHRGWGRCKKPQWVAAAFPDRVFLYEGWFSETFEKVSDKIFCMVHVDCDLYAPAKLCIDFFFPRLVSGGFMVFDDYGFKGTVGVSKAVDEFFTDRIDITVWRDESLIIRKDYISGGYHDSEISKELFG